MIYKLLTIVGARPQFIKAAAFSSNLQKYNEFEEVIVHTGQHYDENMANLFFQQLHIPKPKYILQSGGMSHNQMIGYMISEMDKLLYFEKPSAVVVYGDTNSTIAGALSAKKRNIPIVHIEAGVRNYDETMPEEVNRYLTDRMSSLNFCASKQCLNNLIKEGFSNKEINSDCFFSGDIMLDIFISQQKMFTKAVIQDLNLTDTFLDDFILCTIHRESNVNSKLLGIINDKLNDINKDKKILMVAHPRTLRLLNKSNFDVSYEIIHPLGYHQMMYLLKKCKFVITDSGGLSREAYFANKKSLFLLSKPVWPEIIKDNCSILSNPLTSDIFKDYLMLKTLNPNFSNSIFGTGNSTDLIIKEIKNFLKK